MIIPIIFVFTFQRRYKQNLPRWIPPASLIAHVRHLPRQVHQYDLPVMHVRTPSRHTRLNAQFQTNQNAAIILGGFRLHGPCGGSTRPWQIRHARDHSKTECSCMRKIHQSEDQHPILLRRRTSGTRRVPLPPAVVHTSTDCPMLSLEINLCLSRQ